MKYIDEYRKREEIEKITFQTLSLINNPLTIMEVCGGQTHAIVKHGIDKILEEKINIVHGPGCPVCITPAGYIDLAADLAINHNCIVCTFGDMMRVPGTEMDLISARSMGADIRIIYSPLDAVKIAVSEREKEVVMLAIGFETTAPAHALTVLKAYKGRTTNFSIIPAMALIPPAVEKIVSSDFCSIDGLLAPGHVCTIDGYSRYQDISKKYRIPIVVTGFEPLDIITGIYMLVDLIENKIYEVKNQYSRAVTVDGNKKAQELIDRVFEIENRPWRGMGEIEKSGLTLNDKYSDFNALVKFNKNIGTANKEIDCIAGEILQGIKKPSDCKNFGTRCNPDSPLGAPMVSSEGACAAYYRYNYSMENIPK